MHIDNVYKTMITGHDIAITVGACELRSPTPSRRNTTSTFTLKRMHMSYVLARPTIWTARTPFLNVATELRNKRL